MSLHSWLQHVRSGPAPGRGHRRRPRRSATYRPHLEVLEERTVPSGYQQINLVGYQPGIAHFTDLPGERGRMPRAKRNRRFRDPLVSGADA